MKCIRIHSKIMGISEEHRPQEEIIRVLSPPHCARGPKGCDKCREAAKIKEICLLRIFFDGGMIARPMIEIERDGSKSLHEFDVLRRFETADEALQYASDNNIQDVDLS
ncbi:MAG: hypothetical protein P1Q69_08775 [Candidatus Thorarchaeota archaeon]|nr:hypothetical protein [Candidatus Thorarchaeota archaeon]